MKKGTRMIDIAESLNISVVTVSNALNNRGGVSPELREMIKKIADEIGYQYDNSNLNSLQKHESYNIGVISSEISSLETNTHIWHLSQVISNIVIKKNLFTINETITQKMQKENILPKTVSENKISALIILGNFEESYLSRLTDLNIPLVYIGFSIPSVKCTSIIIDLFNGAYTLTNHLIKNGHKKIGFVGNISPQNNPYFDVFLGYQKALYTNNLYSNDSFNIAVNDVMGNDLKNINFKNISLATAYICSNDDIALRLINSLKKAGYRTPEDISVVGFGNTNASEISDPMITTIDLNMEYIAEHILILLLKKFENHSFCNYFQSIIGELQTKESVKKITAE